MRPPTKATSRYQGHVGARTTACSPGLPDRTGPAEMVSLSDSQINRAARHSGPRTRRVVGLLLFSALLLLYIGTARGTMIHGDDYSMYQVAQSLVDRRDIALGDPPEQTGLYRGHDGRPYSKYGIGLSLVAAPFYWVGSKIAAFGPALTGAASPTVVVTFITLLTNPVLTAATATLLWLLTTALGLRSNQALATALLYSFGTFAWHYAETFMSEPLAAFCLMLGILAAWKAVCRSSLTWVALSGFSFGLLVATRPFNLIVLPFIFLYLVRFRIDRLRLTTIWLLPVLFWIALVAAYNYARFGNIMETGYGGESQAFGNPIFVGLHGLLLSTGKGLIFYCPVIIFAVIGVIPLWKKDRRLTAILLAIVAAYIIAYSRYAIWWGGGSWGPRYLLPIVPILTLFVGMSLPTVFKQAMLRRAFIAVSSAGFLIQLSSVLIDFATWWVAMMRFYGTSAGEVGWAFPQVYVTFYSPILAHLWLLFSGEQWVIAGIRLSTRPLLIGQALSVVASVLLLVYLARRAQREQMPTYSSHGT